MATHPARPTGATGMWLQLHREGMRGPRVACSCWVERWVSMTLACGGRKGRSRSARLLRDAYGCSMLAARRGASGCLSTRTWKRFHVKRMTGSIPRPLPSHRSSHRPINHILNDTGPAWRPQRPRQSPQHQLSPPGIPILRAPATPGSCRCQASHTSSWLCHRRLPRASA